ncbi:MAG: hypothetical protein O6834_00675 [Actinobacteria bacterium]|nr:hypothetical protein [Actinomycetota bacterium]
MRRKSFALLTAATLAISACGAGGGSGSEVPADPDAPVLQIRSEGGFLPVGLVLARGPRYTLLADGRLIHEGPVIAIYPGPLLPNYLESQINEDQMSSVLELIDRIGLPDMESEIDDSAARFVADATTEVVTYWDGKGEHSYSVYALGIESDSSSPSTDAFTDLLVVMDQLATLGSAVTYQPERVQVIAGVGFANPDFSNVRDWPLDNTDFSDWEILPNEWTCTTYGPEVLDTFADATQTTQWTHPDPMMDAPTLTLLVRPLHPGELDCPSL